LGFIAYDIPYSIFARLTASNSFAKALYVCYDKARRNAATFERFKPCFFEIVTMPTLQVVSLGITLSAVALGGCGAGQDYDRAVRELARRIASAEKHGVDDAPTSLVPWIAAKERPEGCVLRAKLLCKLQKPGKAYDELEEAAARWPNNKDIRRAVQECVIEGMRLQIAAERREQTISHLGQELRRETAEQRLRQLVDSSGYWSEKTTEEREAYLRSAFAKGSENVVREVALRTTTVGESETAIQDLLRKWQTD